MRSQSFILLDSQPWVWPCGWAIMAWVSLLIQLLPMFPPSLFSVLSSSVQLPVPGQGCQCCVLLSSCVYPGPLPPLPFQSIQPFAHHFCMAQISSGCSFNSVLSFIKNMPAPDRYSVICVKFGLNFSSLTIAECLSSLLIFSYKYTSFLHIPEGVVVQVVNYFYFF